MMLELCLEGRGIGGEEVGGAFYADALVFVQSLSQGNSQTQLRPAGYWGQLE